MLALLVLACETALKRKEWERDLEPACRVPLITSAREEQMLISTSVKPVVKLLINRHNNKYSYTRYVSEMFMSHSPVQDTSG